MPWTKTPLSSRAERIDTIVTRLASEMDAERDVGQPMLWEHPDPSEERAMLTVLWDEWSWVMLHERRMIMHRALEQASSSSPSAFNSTRGMTYAEAESMGLLPYRIAVSGTLATDEEETMIKAGATRIEGELRFMFPTAESCSGCFQWLTDHAPELAVRMERSTTATVGPSRTTFAAASLNENVTM